MSDVSSVEGEVGPHQQGFVSAIVSNTETPHRRPPVRPRCLLPQRPRRTRQRLLLHRPPLHRRERSRQAPFKFRARHPFLPWRPKGVRGNSAPAEVPMGGSTPQSTFSSWWPGTRQRRTDTGGGGNRERWCRITGGGGGRLRSQAARALAAAA